MREDDQARTAELRQAREAARRRIEELVETDPVLAYAHRRLTTARERNDALAEALQIIEGGAGPPAAETSARERRVGQRLADAFHTAFATWWFVIAQTVFIAVWMAVNIFAWTHFDKYPFLFLNLAFSLWAAYAAPLILMADARAAARERRRIDEQSRQMALILRTLERYAPPNERSPD